jgi:hypothetical protein
MARFYNKNNFIDKKRASLCTTIQRWRCSCKFQKSKDWLKKHKKRKIRQSGNVTVIKNVHLTGFVCACLLRWENFQLKHIS